MVRLLRIARAVFVLAAVGLTSTAFGLDLLEKLQAEVAAIVKSSKGAVVTIEDDVLQLGWFPDGKAFDEDLDKGVARAIKQAREELARVAEEAPHTTTGRAAQREARAKLRAMDQKEELRQKGLDAAKEAIEHSRAFRIRVPKSGSGFSLGEGVIVTTADVVEGMEKPIVITDDGTRIKAKVTGIDPELNVAILTIPKRAGLPALKWGDSAGALPGFFVISIGNQTGNLNSAALNLVSNIRGGGTLAGKRFYPRLLQIAGTVGAGTSGAPLLNTRGEVIGMMAAVPTAAMPWTVPGPVVPGIPPAAPLRGVRGVSVETAKTSSDSGKQPELDDDDSWIEPQGNVAVFRPLVTSAGFAVPSNELRPVIEALREGRQATRGYIGITTLDDQKYESDGEISRLIRIVRLASVVESSPAYKAGLQKHDILVALNGKPVTDMNEVRAVAMTSSPGEVLRVDVRRNGKPLQFEIIIGERPPALHRNKAKEPIKKGHIPARQLESLRDDERYAN